MVVVAVMRYGEGGRGGRVSDETKTKEVWCGDQETRDAAGLLLFNTLSPVAINKKRDFWHDNRGGEPICLPENRVRLVIMM